MRKIFILPLFIVGIFFTSSPVSAQQYPIKELGNCSNATSCHIYCDRAENTPACWSYGKYVLHKNVLGEQTVSLTFPIAELGNCASSQACKEYCSQSANYEACTAFGRKKGFIKQKTQEKESKEKLIKAAQEKLGCTDEASCRALCSDPTNQGKCTQIAREVGLMQDPLKKAKQERREEKRGYGQNRDEWCKQNPDRCKDIRELKASDASRPSGAPEKWEMKRGCTNQKECMTICQQNPGRCPGFPKPTGFEQKRPDSQLSIQ